MTDQPTTPPSDTQTSVLEPQEQLIEPTVDSVDGQMLSRMFEGAAGWLEQHVPHINALNVFPVPDGDTGTNMMLTLQSAMKELRGKLREGESVAEVANCVARGALMGARGNSGVILSQILRGFARGLEGKERATTQDIAEALQHAAEMAYKSVMKPVEGTILTVIREAAESARKLAKEKRETNLVQFLQGVVEAAKQAELRTPEMLPVLKEAGVTDSGGHGLWVFLDGALRNLRGEKIAPSGETPGASLALAVDPEQASALIEGEWGYDIQYLIKGYPSRPLNVEAIREYISSIGDCALVVGDETLVKVHVHCPNPGPAITYGAEQGIIADVVVENMDEQAEAFLQEEPIRQRTTTRTTDEVTGIGIVAVAPGEGLIEVFKSLGVSQVVSGGQTMNPSTQDLLDAVEAVKADTVIILPNNKNVIPAANQVPPLSTKQVHILPTRTVPQGISAVMAFNYAADITENLETMEEALAHVQTGEITTGVRTTSVEGVSVQEGDIIGLLNGKLVVADQDVESVVRAMLDRIELNDYEIATFYYGANVLEGDAARLIEALRERYDTLEFDLVPGGQPHYHYIFSVE